MSRGGHHLLAIICITVLFGTNQANGQESTVPGPESKSLVSATAGYLSISDRRDFIKVIRLPDLSETAVRPKGKSDPLDMPTVHSLSGPDSEGRIAYIEDHFFVLNQKNRHHLLKTIKIDSSEDTTLFSRPGDAMWAGTRENGEISRDLSLSPVGGQVAFLSDLQKVQMPGALLSVGGVEVWDLQRKSGARIGIKALAERLAWFPDGKRLAYVKLVEPAQVASSLKDDAFGAGFREWNKVPAVYVWDAQAKTDSLVHVGWRPVVSADGQSLLMENWEGAYAIVQVPNGKARYLTPKGNYRAIALLRENVLLMWSLPTKGVAIKYTESNSPLRGPKEMLALKLLDLKSGDFQTVAPSVDPRQRVSFGMAKQK